VEVQVLSSAPLKQQLTAFQNFANLLNNPVHIWYTFSEQHQVPGFGRHYTVMPVSAPYERRQVTSKQLHGSHQADQVDQLDESANG
jgi:hypothetical protein